MQALCIAGILAAQTVQGQGVGELSRVRQDPLLVAEEVFKATVTSVEDGDSLVVKTVAGGDSMTIQVADVDAPELSQAGGPEARAFLARLTLRKPVTVRIKSSDRSARIDVDGTDVSQTLIREGMAWHCPRFADDRDLTAAEADARAAKRGLWSAARPTPPWLHRGAGACWQQKKERTARRGPDFSGRWTVVGPPERTGQKVAITQDAINLTIEQSLDSGLTLATYKLDGTTSRVLLTPHGAIDIVAKTRWNGPRLVVDERRWPVHGEEATSVRQVLWIDERGLLNLETSSPRPIGESDVRMIVLRREAQ